MQSPKICGPGIRIYTDKEVARMESTLMDAGLTNGVVCVVVVRDECGERVPGGGGCRQVE
jgi:hypothetical protein